MNVNVSMNEVQKEVCLLKCKSAFTQVTTEK